MKPSSHDRNLPNARPSDLRRPGDLPDPINLKIRRLERELATYQALCDQAYVNGYVTATRESEQTRDVPGELLEALRHGHAHHHVHVPVGDHLVAIVLARSGEGRPQPRREAKAWETIRSTHRSVLASARPGVDLMVRRELPSAIGALTWRWDGQVAVVLGQAAHRRCLKRAIRCVARAWTLLALPVVVSAGKLKVLVPHLATPTMTMSAAVAAVTAIATTPAIVYGAVDHKPPATAERQVDDALPSVGRTSPAAATQDAKSPRAKDPKQADEQAAPAASSLTVQSPAPAPAISPPLQPTFPSIAQPSSAPPTEKVPGPTPEPSLPPSPLAGSAPPDPSPTVTPSVGSSGGAGSPSESLAPTPADPTSPPEAPVPVPTPVPPEDDPATPSPTAAPECPTGSALTCDPSSSSPSPVPEGVDR